MPEPYRPGLSGGKLVDSRQVDKFPDRVGTGRRPRVRIQQDISLIVGSAMSQSSSHDRQVGRACISDETEYSAHFSYLARIVEFPRMSILMMNSIP